MTTRDTLVAALGAAQAALMDYDQADASYPFRTILVEQAGLFPVILIRVQSDPVSRKSGSGWIATWGDGSQVFYRRLSDFRKEFCGHYGPLKEVYRP